MAIPSPYAQAAMAVAVLDPNADGPIPPVMSKRDASITLHRYLLRYGDPEVVRRREGHDDTDPEHCTMCAPCNYAAWMRFADWLRHHKKRSVRERVLLMLAECCLRSRKSLWVPPDMMQPEP